MDYKKLVEGLRNFHENYVAEMCYDGTFACDDLCDSCHENCIMVQAIDAIGTLLAEREAAIEKILKLQKHNRLFRSLENNEEGENEQMKIMCSCCGNTSQFVYSLSTAKLAVARGWNSFGHALYCPECSATWSERNGSRPLAGKDNTIRIIERQYRKERERAYR